MQSLRKARSKVILISKINNSLRRNKLWCEITKKKQKQQLRLNQMSALLGHEKKQIHKKKTEDDESQTFTQFSSTYSDRKGQTAVKQIFQLDIVKLYQ